MALSCRSFSSGVKGDEISGVSESCGVTGELIGESVSLPTKQLVVSLDDTNLFINSFPTIQGGLDDAGHLE